MSTGTTTRALASGRHPRVSKRRGGGGSYQIDRLQGSLEGFRRVVKLAAVQQLLCAGVAVAHVPASNEVVVPCYQEPELVVHSDTEATQWERSPTQRGRERLNDKRQDSLPLGCLQVRVSDDGRLHLGTAVTRLLHVLHLVVVVAYPGVSILNFDKMARNRGDM